MIPESSLVFLFLVSWSPCSVFRARIPLLLLSTTYDSRTAARCARIGLLPPSSFVLEYRIKKIFPKYDSDLSLRLFVGVPGSTIHNNHPPPDSPCILQYWYIVISQCPHVLTSAAVAPLEVPPLPSWSLRRRL